jgi:hypothetical protein
MDLGTIRPPRPLPIPSTHTARLPASGWNDKITQDEVEVLVNEHRLSGSGYWRWDATTKAYVKTGKPMPTAKEVNAANGPGGSSFSSGFGHDAINRHILIETRAKRLGVYGRCDQCGGSGSVFTAPEARLGLVLWVLHPRKGCSRGVDIKNIEQSELPDVYAYLSQAAERNAARFAKIPGP